MAAVLRRKVTAAEELAQLDLDFTSPLDHYELLFRDRQQECVILWHKDRRDQPKETRGGPVWQSLDRFKAYSALVDVAGEFDKYVTPNEFAGWRLLHLLRGLNAVYLDFDSHQKRLTQQELLQWRDEVLKQIRVRGWPEPTFSVMTGRGFHLYWIHDRADRRTLPRWQALIRTMRKALDADPMSADCCRVLRILGTRNSSANDGDFIVHGFEHAGTSYDFEWLYETICKPQKAEIRDMEAERKARAERKAARATKADAPKDAGRFTNILGWWQRVNEDLWKIAAHISQRNDGAGVPEGCRTLLLELFCAAVCWFRPAEELEGEVIAFARTFLPSLSEHEVLRDTATLRNRAAMAAKGETAVFQGERVDARYKYSRERLWEKIGQFVPEALYPELQALLPDDIAAERSKAREKARQKGRDRVKEGKYAAHNTGKGHRAINALKVALARDKKAAGASVASIARELQTPEDTVRSWLRRAKR